MRCLLLYPAIALLLFPLLAHTTEIQGEVWGTWPGPDTVRITGDTRVSPGSTLVIEPGVTVVFEGHYRFGVDTSATLTAIGTQTDSIIFTARCPAVGWEGIRLRHVEGVSQLSYCRIEHGKASGGGPDGYGGGILCYYSSPTISDNSIIENSADQRGGAICCFFSNPSILRNRIEANTAKGGGGVFCSKSRPSVSGNLIVDNIAASRGGGIYCVNSSPHINNNTIAGNSVGHSGGGICCYDRSRPIIRNNIIEGNTAVYRGGGIYCRDYSSPSISRNRINGNASKSGGGINCLVDCNATIDSNLIEDNTAGLRGGAIYCEFSALTIYRNSLCRNHCGGFGGALYCFEVSSPVIMGNTLAENVADTCGGGIYSWVDCTPRIRDCILWSNSAPEDPQLYIRESGSVVTYCNIEGGYPGLGNLDADPIFVGPERGDLQLRWHSPCIDRGNPGSPLDPDGTRTDIGAFYFKQDLLGIVELYPKNPPIVIPPQGGDFAYDGWAFNFSGNPGTFDVWAYLFVPGVGRSGPWRLYRDVQIPEDSTGHNRLSQSVPGFAPEGDYVYVAYIGAFPGTIVDSSYFYFSKSASIGGGTAKWSQNRVSDKAGLVSSRPPCDFSLSQNYPNPFNAVTTIHYQLPVDSDVRLQICNVLGQKVATIVDKRQQAGYRSVVWDASGVSSGIYFYRLTAQDFTETRRMMLVK